MFFFCKQKTAYEMRISDWSSDVCSSDLYQAAEPPELVRAIGCSCVASPVAQALVGAAQPVPVPEIEAEVAVIVTVMAVMMAGRDQPFADPPVHRRSGEKLPTHVIGDAEEGHDRQHGEQRRRSEEPKSEIQTLMPNSSAVFTSTK